jgi:hypothetical protein
MKCNNRLYLVSIILDIMLMKIIIKCTLYKTILMFSNSMTCHHHQFPSVAPLWLCLCHLEVASNLAYVFLNLMASSALLSNRCGINSILIGSLLTLLRQKVLAEGGASDYISQAIVNTSSRFGDVEVATTRVPEFGSELQTPVFAYQSFGLLSSLDLRMSPPPAPLAIIIHNKELLTLLADTSASQTFL